MARLAEERKQQIKDLIKRKEGVLCSHGVVTPELLQAMAEVIRSFNDKFVGIKMDEEDEGGNLGSMTWDMATPVRDSQDELTGVLLKAALEDPNSEAFKQLPEHLQNYVAILVKSRRAQTHQEATKTAEESAAKNSSPQERMKTGYRPRSPR